MSKLRAFVDELTGHREKRAYDEGQPSAQDQLTEMLAQAQYHPEPEQPFWADQGATVQEGVEEYGHGKGVRDREIIRSPRPPKDSTQTFMRDRPEPKAPPKSKPQPQPQRLPTEPRDPGPRPRSIRREPKRVATKTAAVGRWMLAGLGKRAALGAMPVPAAPPSAGIMPGPTSGTRWNAPPAPPPLPGLGKQARRRNA